MTKNEAAIAFAQGKKVECRMPGEIAWISALEFGAFDEDWEFRLKPEPIPPGDLTFEEACECVKKKVPVQYYSSKDKEWIDSLSNYKWDLDWLNKHISYRRKPQPQMVELGPEDLTPGTLLRCGEFPDYVWKFMGYTPSGVYVGWNLVRWTTLREAYEYKPGGIGEWKRCEKERK